MQDSVSHLGSALATGADLDGDFLDKWATSLDERIGSDEVTERIRRAQQQAPRRGLQK